MLVADIRELVQRACHRSENAFGPSFFDQHLAVVAECATTLAARLGADLEVVELAGYLHDLSAVCDPTTMPDHPRLSADLATQLLLERGYPEARVGCVARSIASHSDPLLIGSGPPEEVCISNADAVSRILRPAYRTYFAFGVRKFGFEEGRLWLRSLIERQWCKLIEPAKDLVGQQYATTLDLLAK